MAKPGFLERVHPTDPTLSFVIDEFTATRKRLGRTQEQVLRSMQTYPLAMLKCSQVNS